MTDDRANVCLVGRNPHGVALDIPSVFAPYSLPSSTTPAINSSSMLTMSGDGARAFLNVRRSRAVADQENRNRHMGKFALVSAADQAGVRDAPCAVVEVAEMHRLENQRNRVAPLKSPIGDPETPRL